MKTPLFYTLVTTAIHLVTWFIGGTCLAAIPAPPVNQQLGIPDHNFKSMTEQVCRACHNQNPPSGIPVDQTFLPDRHHMNLGLNIPPNSDVLFPDGDDDGVRDTVYTCSNCHELIWDETAKQFQLSILSDCMQCHVYSIKGSVHHRSAKTTQLDCKSCHGGVINNHPTEGSNPDDHYIPTYKPSNLTPWPSGKVSIDNIFSPSSAGTYSGNCDYCHNTAYGILGGGNPESTPIGQLSIDNNADTHHGAAAGFLVLPGELSCMVCHDFFSSPEYAIRRCENCHGADSLHSIAVDTDEDGFNYLREEPGYSHVGSIKDCQGCHDKTPTTLEDKFSVGVIPSINSMSGSTITAGIDTILHLGGTSFTNKTQNPSGNSIVQLIDKAGNITELIATYINDYNIDIFIPGTMEPGSYRIFARKQDRVSNPMVLNIKPEVSINRAICNDNTLNLSGNGFGDYSIAGNSGTGLEVGVETGVITSWNNREISAQFSECKAGEIVTVHTIFGSISTTIQ